SESVLPGAQRDSRRDQSHFSGSNSIMQTKAYFASSVPAALEVARQELGENALLVGSRPTPPQARQFGRLEVTCAGDPKEAPLAPGPVQAAAVHGTNSAMDEIREELTALRAAVGRGGNVPGAMSQI